LKKKLNKVKNKGEYLKLLEVVLEKKRREIIKEWINSGRIEAIQQFKNTTGNQKNVIKELRGYFKK
jgi:hypothetical protein